MKIRKYSTANMVILLVLCVSDAAGLDTLTGTSAACVSRTQLGMYVVWLATPWMWGLLWSWKILRSSVT